MDLCVAGAAITLFSSGFYKQQLLYHVITEYSSGGYCLLSIGFKSKHFFCRSSYLFSASIISSSKLGYGSTYYILVLSLAITLWRLFEVPKIVITLFKSSNQQGKKTPVLIGLLCLCFYCSILLRWYLLLATIYCKVIVMTPNNKNRSLSSIQLLLCKQTSESLYVLPAPSNA